MNDILKQRLVGALVIVVLAVIFWPVVFVGPEGEPPDRSTQVPRIPSLRQMQLDAPQPLQGIAPAQLPAASLSDATAEPESPPAAATAEAESPPGLDKNGIPIAWTLQVVSVGKQDKAEALMQQLLEMGYKAYFKAVAHGDETLYRVYVGPKFSRATMQDAKRVIDKKFRVKSIITRYLP